MEQQTKSFEAFSLGKLWEIVNEKKTGVFEKITGKFRIWIKKNINGSSSDNNAVTSHLYAVGGTGVKSCVTDRTLQVILYTNYTQCGKEMHYETKKNHT